MAKMVTVSLLSPRGYRPSKDAEVVRYPRGLVEMPLDHAVAMDLTHRIRTVKKDPATGTTEVTPLAFDGAFDDKITATLQAAGFATMDDVRRATQSELMAIPGVGPAVYERIQVALQGE